jgi:hypothetical protein
VPKGPPGEGRKKAVVHLSPWDVILSPWMSFPRKEESGCFSVFPLDSCFRRNHTGSLTPQGSTSEEGKMLLPSATIGTVIFLWPLEQTAFPGLPKSIFFRLSRQVSGGRPYKGGILDGYPSKGRCFPETLLIEARGSTPFSAPAARVGNSFSGGNSILIPVIHSR